MATTAQLAEKVLQKLNVVESGETVDSADQTIVTDKYASIYELLAAEDLVSWGSGDDIPTEAVTSIVSIVAEDCITEFSVRGEAAMKVMADAQKGRDNLKKLEHVDYVPDEDPHYF
jgi:hypothetical protein